MSIWRILHELLFVENSFTIKTNRLQRIWKAWIRKNGKRDNIKEIMKEIKISKNLHQLKLN